MSVHTLAAKIAPQRSTQYTALADTLARPELTISPLGPLVRQVERISLAGHGYLRVRLHERPPHLPTFATLTEWFELYETLGGEPGPFLRPIPATEPVTFSEEIVEARRYRGKTNELFTHFLINVARWTHGGQPRWLLDPMAGGGTTLFTGLRLGLSVMGVEKDKVTLEGTDTFLKQFLQTEHVRHQREMQRRKAGSRIRYTLPLQQQAVLALGDTRDAGSLLEALPGGSRPDLVVVDLPYAIQHTARGSLKEVVPAALQTWYDLAAPNAVLALAWNATTLARVHLLEWMSIAGWMPITGGPYDEMSHRVDRVIKERDVLVARR